MNPRHWMHGLKVAYYRAVPRLRHALGRPRRVLMYVSSDTMLPHLLRYYRSVEALPNVRFFSLYPSQPRSAGPTLAEWLALPITRVDSVGHTAWDLIVCADMPTPSGVSKEMTPLLYVNHGLHIVSADGGENLYCYGKLALDEHGKPLFTRMCEPNERILAAMRTHEPAMAAVMTHTGFKYAEEIDRAVANRAETRRRLGVSDDVCLVGLFGTWREHSLFHTLGAEVFDICDRMRPEGWQFLFSIHPNEYRRYDGRIEPMGAQVEAQRERGMLVRSPGEPFEDVLAACDIVVSDYSSMAESAILAGRKLIFSAYPDGMVWKHSLTAEARRALPTVSSAAELPRVLRETRQRPLDPFIPQARQQMLRCDHDEIMRRLTLNLMNRTEENA